tara:strand:- start:936 stop:1175 length:240 start_codon:yes stop_codon:yes gene_type:complete
MDKLNNDNTELEKTFKEWENAEKENINYIEKKEKTKWFQFIILSFLNLMSYLLKISLANLENSSYTKNDIPNYSIEDID